MKNKGLMLLYASVLVSATGYGISFPLLSISLEQMGVSGKMIGLNAAMPALGWLIGSFFLPRLQAVFGLRAVLLGFLSIVMLALIGFSLVRDYWAWIVLRFLFGGSLGLFYRAIEFWINSISENSMRGRNIGIYATLFVLGLAIGSAIQPLFGTQGFLPYMVILGLFLVSTLFIASISFDSLTEISRSVTGCNTALVLSMPVVFLAIFAYGMVEDIAVYLMSVYALRNNLGTDVAAYSLTAVAIGNIVFMVPVGLLSDYMSRMTLLLVCAAIFMGLSLAIPFTLHSSAIFLLVLIIWGGMLGLVYIFVLAIIGDRYEGEQLASANAAFGIVYATGGLIGPLINGAAIDTLDSHGMMISAAAIFGGFIILSFIIKRFYTADSW